ncbi:sodium/glutamate symporter [Endozoicomonas sp. Mp262]|uniref:sodium/glutamate symporter n=1 Tax=Endozoicomonas sp. Mp262 TaxID=2919499 RepID=UPI0021DB230E
MTHISGIYLLFMALVILFLGRFVTSYVPWLKRWHIPSPVTGGLLCSLLITLVSYFTATRFSFDLYLRDILLLCFFSTIGLSARIRLLISGGKTLTTLMVIAVLFLIVQNTAGVATALALGSDPIHGLLAGTITFAGGHGTAITWGTFLEGKGYEGAMEFGLIAATLGLILGGLVGGPVARRLIHHYQLRGDSQKKVTTPTIEQENQPVTLNGRHLLSAIFCICTCIIVGLAIQDQLKALGVVLPDFVPVLFTGILITNLCDSFKLSMKQPELNMLGDISLQLFIAMSLMTLKLHYLASVAGVLIAITVVQVIVIILFAWFVVFQAAGRNYDSSIITAGFIGMGLGATPVGMANMNTLAHRYGPSPKAFLVVPLIGSFFIDIANALILKGFLLLPVFTAGG